MKFMKPAEESILSAYLDDELELDARGIVESAALANPRVADRLAELALVRDLVAGLPREPLRLDLSGAVVARIAAERADRIRRARRLLVASCAMATAAAILLATSFSWSPRDPIVARVATTTKARPRTLFKPLTQAVHLAASQPAPIISPSSIAIPSELLAAEEQARQDSLTLNELMTGSEARDILVEVDDLDDSTLDKVEDAIKRSNRREPKHAQLRLYQQVTKDPYHPGKVAAYVLVMDDVERSHFGRNLEAVLPGAAHPDATADPGLIARLPQIGRIEIRGGLPRGTLLPPPSHVARQEAFRHEEPARSDDASGAKGEMAGGLPGRGMIGASRNGAPSPDATEQRPPCVYVVWVTTRDGPRPRTN